MLPDTFDSLMSILWVIILLLVVAAAIIIFVIVRRRRSNKDGDRYRASSGNPPRGKHMR